MAINAIDLQPCAAFDDENCDARMIRAWQVLCKNAVVRGRHYQRDDGFKQADFSRGPAGLSRPAAGSSNEYRGYCGAHFVADHARVALERMLDI